MKRIILLACVTMGVAAAPFAQNGQITPLDPVQQALRRTSFSGPPTVVASSRPDAAPSRHPRLNYRSGVTPYEDVTHVAAYHFGHYVTEPDGKAAPSPWYWYPHLPAYVDASQVKSAGMDTFDFYGGAAYHYQAHHFRPFDSGQIDCVADRIDEAFRGRDFDRMAWLFAPDNFVQVQVDGADQYDVKGEALARMTRDMMEGTNMSSFHVTELRSWDGGASVAAIQVFVDPWGDKQTVRLSYGLEKTARGYRLASFRTDHF